VGPNYRRPSVQVPKNFRAPLPLAPPAAESLADLQWFQVFNDAKLQDLIRTALERNYDLRAAVANVEAARANLGTTRSHQYPNFTASGDLQITRLSRDGAFTLPPAFLPSQNRNWGEASLNLLSFELDIWGRLRRATEAARANLLSADENRKAVITTLVADVAGDYFTLRQLDQELEVSQRTMATRRESLRLIKLARKEESPRGSTSARASSWYTPRRRPFPRYRNKSNRPKTESAYCWREIQRASSAAAA
jgi:multidrug efflux system outer membrane protein